MLTAADNQSGDAPVQLPSVLTRDPATWWDMPAGERAGRTLRALLHLLRTTPDAWAQVPDTALSALAHSLPEALDAVRREVIRRSTADAKPADQAAVKAAADAIRAHWRRAQTTTWRNLAATESDQAPTSIPGRIGPCGHDGCNYQPYHRGRHSWQDGVL